MKKRVRKTRRRKRRGKVRGTGKRGQSKKAVKREPRQEPLDDAVLRDIIVGAVGEHGYEIAKKFTGNETTDEEVAMEMGIRVNLVRRILYTLYENHVVSYRRARDEESGWYLYYWRVDPERALEHYNKNKRLLLQKLEERFETERDTMFFGCKNDDPKLSFELAAENDFKCPRCGGKLEPYDNSGVIAALDHKINSIRQRLVNIGS